MPTVETTTETLAAEPRRRVETIVSGVKDKAGEIVSGVKHKAEDIVSGAKDKADTLKKQSLEDLWTGTRDYVKDNPGKTVLISLGIGFVLGTFLRRR
jgi:ElaB/YqjD/DUF883 family membrane-anchored ribosome-binding protein